VNETDRETLRALLTEGRRKLATRQAAEQARAKATADARRARWQALVVAVRADWGPLACLLPAADSEPPKDWLPNTTWEYEEGDRLSATPYGSAIIRSGDYRPTSDDGPYRRHELARRYEVATHYGPSAADDGESWGRPEPTAWVATDDPAEALALASDAEAAYGRAVEEMHRLNADLTRHAPAPEPTPEQQLVAGLAALIRRVVKEG
jgi:hypothetical protein